MNPSKCAVCGFDVLKPKTDFYVITCVFKHDAKVICRPCINKGIPVYKCTKCGEPLDTAQLVGLR